MSTMKYALQTVNSNKGGDISLVSKLIPMTINNKSEKTDHAFDGSVILPYDVRHSMRP